MRYLFCSIAIFASSLAFGWNFDSDSLQKKCLIETPAWMGAQIEKDLKAFSRVDADKIEATMKAILKAKGGDAAALVRIQTQGGEIKWSTSFELSDRSKSRLTTLISAMDLLNTVAPLPDVDFLLSLANRYDRPLFSLFTKVPVFTVCKETSFQQSVLFPSALWESEQEKLFNTVSTQASKTDWKTKASIAFWRGSASELFTNFYWDFNQRPRVIYMSRANPSLIDAAFIDNQYISAMNSHWQSYVRGNGMTKPFVKPEDQLVYRYLLAMDGEAAPGSLPWQLFSGSTLIKSDSTVSEWFYSALEPDVHYVPFNPNRSELIDKILWLQQNDDKAYEIALNAKSFAEEWLSDESAFLYMYKLLQAYAQLQQ